MKKKQWLRYDVTINSDSRPHSHLSLEWALRGAGFRYSMQVISETSFRGFRTLVFSCKLKRLESIGGLAEHLKTCLSDPTEFRNATYEIKDSDPLLQLANAFGQEQR